MKIFKNLFTTGFKASTIFFMAGILVSMLITSVGISSSVASQQLKNSRYEVDGEQYQLLIQPNGKLTELFWDKLYETLSDDEGFYVDGINMPVSYMSDAIPKVYPEIFKGDTGIFPLLKGNYFTYENVKNKDKVALVGKDTEMLLPEINGKKYISMSGTKYEVIGVVGYKGRESVWDKSTYFPINSLPDKEQSNITNSQLKVNIYNKCGDIEKQLEKIKTLFTENSIVLMQSKKIIPQKISFWQAISPRYSDNFVIYIFFIVSLINSLNIALSWISKRKFEIGVRKAFGHSNLHILHMIFLEILLIFTVGAIFATSVHLLLFKMLGNFVSVVEFFSFEAILSSLFLVLASTVVATVFTSSKILSVQPVESLKC